MNKREIGKTKEESCEKVLVDAGYDIVERNFATRIGEIDIIAENNEELLFIEVKYRKSKQYGYGEESVNKTKARKIFKTARQYIYKKNIQDKQIRFDIISIEDNEIRWIKNSFWGDEIGL